MTLQEFADKLAEAWGDISEKMEKLAEALRNAFDEANKKIEEHKRLLRRPPKWFLASLCLPCKYLPRLFLAYSYSCGNKVYCLSLCYSSCR